MLLATPFFYSCIGCVGHLIDPSVHTPLSTGLILSYIGSIFSRAIFLLLFHKLIFMLWNSFQEVDESDSNATGEASQSKKIGADPFNNNEAEPAKSGAMRKYFIISNRCYLILFFFFGCFPCSPE